METIIDNLLASSTLTETTIFSAVVWMILVKSLDIRATSIISVILLTGIVPTVAILVSLENNIVNTILTSLSVIGLYGILRAVKQGQDQISNMVEKDLRKSSRKSEETTTTREESISENTNGHYTLTETTTIHTITTEDEESDSDNPA